MKYVLLSGISISFKHQRYMMLVLLLSVSHMYTVLEYSKNEYSCENSFTPLDLYRWHSYGNRWIVYVYASYMTTQKLYWRTSVIS